MNTFDSEQAREYDYIIGIDEAGRGALAGPVAVAATWWAVHGDTTVEVLDGPRKNRVVVRDSKKMTASARARSFDAISARGRHAIVLEHHDVVDNLNVLQATLRGMRTCAETCIEQMDPDAKILVLVDGSQTITTSRGDVRTVESGDDKSFAVGAASILAKHARDTYMLQLHGSFPQYGFDKHKGYGTRSHLDAISTHGPCPEHRMSFRPFRAATDFFVDD